jgi:hypothetical protein
MSSWAMVSRGLRLRFDTAQIRTNASELGHLRSAVAKGAWEDCYMTGKGDEPSTPDGLQYPMVDLFMVLVALSCTSFLKKKH